MKLRPALPMLVITGLLCAGGIIFEAHNLLNYFNANPIICNGLADGSGCGINHWDAPNARLMILIACCVLGGFVVGLLTKRGKQ